ncbi:MULTISPECIES: CD1375 family protein [unclassified Paenibacillus]|nr:MULTISPECIES: CD1375 family protein [unclassified Paenibacillus]MDK8181970.1 CD1375 family protein [Paenibacillus sp. UMB4589-SE434]
MIENMVYIYAELILAGRRDIESVPEELQDAVNLIIHEKK